MRRSFYALALIVSAVLFAMPAAAADNGFYLGGSVGSANITTGDLSQISVDGTATAYKVFAGFRFLTFVSVEGAYADLGSISKDQNEAKVKGYNLQAVGYIPLGIADIFGKAGMMQWNSDVTIGGTTPSTVSKDGTDPVYGAGVQFRIQSWAIRGEVEYYDIKNADSVYMYSVGASYTF